ncbi:hypothetical protein SAMN05660420_03179 [Desulfuromusa kysingii]|uniref:DUF4124 domain-containing protein n=1 Tax=Desulfuromusa kysingii TaxID=37625 RepID=A0A1H4E0P2_9BACT|nr:hypothetical protein [Desulfuromusa kysingii]SEA78339.1 hypothetical protein SAMN05660420_03179 [Desulfuromusa kysingii]
MLKLLRYFLWLVVLVTLMLSFDQLMLKLPLNSPGLKQTQRFYVDFRTRLFGLLSSAPAPAPTSIESVIRQTKTTPVKTEKKSNRYVYVDANGTLQFADSFQQVPVEYRRDAQILAE